MAVRRPFVRRQAAAFVVAGRGRAVPLVPIAKILMERHRKIMMDRLARLKPVTPTTPLVGATPFPVHPFISQPPAPLRAPSRLPVTGVPAVPGSTPFPPTPVIPRPPAPARPPPGVPVFGLGRGSTPFPPTPVIPRPPPPARPPSRVPVFNLGRGSTPFPARPAIPRPPARLPPQARVPPFAPPAVVGSTPFPATPTFRRVLRPSGPVRIPVFGVPAAPGVSSVPFLLRPSFRDVPSRTLPQRIFTVPTGIPVGEVTVCTSGVWSTVISFVACDSYRLEIDGPALDNPKVSVTMEFEE